MHYALDFRTFLFSHYFYRGLRVACGVIGITLLALQMTEDMSITMTVFLGALCVSLVDLPSPMRHKFNEMLAGLLLCTFVMLLISACSTVPLLMYLSMVLVCFFSSMMLVYGKKTISLQFAALLVMSLAMANDFPLKTALWHTLLFFLGGGGFLAYAMLVSYLLKSRFKQQILAEALFELAQYLNIKSGFYDKNLDLNNQFNLLIREQIVLAEKQQAARDMVLRDIQPEQDGRLIQVHLAMLEVYEHILSMHADYALLREYFKSSDIMMFLRDLAGKTCTDLESIAYAVTRNKVSISPVNYKAEVLAIAYEMERIDRNENIPSEAISVLHATYNKIRDLIELIGRLHLATRAPIDAPSMFNNKSATPFLTQERFKLSLLRSHMNMQSPYFRFSLRVALAVSCGLWIGTLLPYSSFSHWIVLTIIITLKPNFSMTRQRMNDRLMGTAIGCMITVLVLHYIREPAALLGILFMASIAAPAFNTIKYRYTAIAASIQILLLMHMMMPDHGGVLMVGERLLDTMIGVGLSAAFGFFLPSWEYQGLQRVLQSVLQTNKRYIKAAADMLSGKVPDDFFYRISRKDFMNSLATLIDTIARMSSEPQPKQKAITELNRFAVENYLIAAHIAALRIVVRRYASSTPGEDSKKLVANTLSTAEQRLDLAGKILHDCSRQANAPAIPTPPAPAEPEFVLESDSPEMHDWSGWHTLQRRTDLLAAEVLQVLRHTEAISHALYQQSISNQQKKSA